MAELLDADMLVILTSVDNVCLNYGTEDEKPLSTMTVAEAKQYMEEGQFGEDDMLPKIQAAIDFIGDSAIRSVLITKLNKEGHLCERWTGYNDHEINCHFYGNNKTESIAENKFFTRKKDV